jgi:hypothetical protein
LRCVHAHAEDEHSGRQRAEAAERHRQPHHQAAAQREHQPEQDSRPASVGIGNFSGGIGHQEAAQAEQRDGQSGPFGVAAERDHHQGSEAEGEVEARAGKRLRDREKRGVSLDQWRNAVEGCTTHGRAL